MRWRSKTTELFVYEFYCYMARVEKFTKTQRLSVQKVLVLLGQQLNQIKRTISSLHTLQTPYKNARQGHIEIKKYIMNIPISVKFWHASFLRVSRRSYRRLHVRTLRTYSRYGNLISRRASTSSFP